MKARSDKPGKRDAILNAMLDVVVERGFHDAPMSLIARRSGASAGVIYHYFASKEAIIEALYERIRSVKRASILAGYSAEMPDKEAFLHVAQNIYRFYRQQSKELRFLEQYEHAGFPCQPGSAAPVDDELAAFERRFAHRGESGILRNWPPAVLEELTVGIAIRLARQPGEIPPEVFREITESIWEMVRAR
jgi:AcrR family transcriptional regulator